MHDALYLLNYKSVRMHRIFFNFFYVAGNNVISWYKEIYNYQSVTCKPCTRLYLFCLFYFYEKNEKYNFFFPIASENNDTLRNVSCNWFVEIFDKLLLKLLKTPIDSTRNLIGSYQRLLRTVTQKVL